MWYHYIVSSIMTNININNLKKQKELKMKHKWLITIVSRTANYYLRDLRTYDWINYELDNDLYCESTIDNIIDRVHNEIDMFYLSFESENNVLIKWLSTYAVVWDFIFNCDDPSNNEIYRRIYLQKLIAEFLEKFKKEHEIPQYYIELINYYYRKWVY